jgi:hypothetical protein
MPTTLGYMVYRDGPAFSPAPADPGGPPRGSRLSDARTRLAASRSLAEPLLIIVIGIALGLVDQTSSEVSGMLRIPALIAALILVGQGLNLLEDVRNAREVEEVLEEERERAPAGAAEAAAPPSPQVVVAGATDDVVEPRRTPTRAYFVLGLAIWLGVATLAYPTAPLQLILLSLLSAYLLFAKGWRTMQTSGEE